MHGARRLPGVERHRGDRAGRRRAIGGWGPKRATGISAPAIRITPACSSVSASAASTELRSTRCGPGTGMPDVEGVADDRVGGLGVEHRLHPLGMRLGLRRRDEARADARALGAGRERGGDPARGRDPAGGDDRQRDGAEHRHRAAAAAPAPRSACARRTPSPWRSRRRSRPPPPRAPPRRTRPASRRRAPPACTSSTSAGSASARKKSTYGARSAASSSEPRSITPGKKLTPNARVSRGERVEHRRERLRRQPEHRVHPVPAGGRDRERQRGRRRDAAHRRELDREIAVQQLGDPGGGHAPRLRLRGPIANAFARRQWDAVES